MAHTYNPSYRDLEQEDLRFKARVATLQHPVSKEKNFKGLGL